MARYSAVLFDFDDTLVDSYSVRYRAAEIAADGILDPAVDLKQVMREWASRPQFEIWLHLTGSEEKASEMQAAYRKWYWSEGTELVGLYPGVPAMLDELKSNGVTLAIVSSKTRLKYDNGRPWGSTV